MELADRKTVELFLSQHSLSDEVKSKIPPPDTRPGLEEGGIEHRHMLEEAGIEHRHMLEEAGIEHRHTLEEAGIEHRHTLEEAGIEHRYVYTNINNNYAYDTYNT